VPKPQAAQTQAEPQAQRQLASDDYDVINKQQAYDDNDDLEYDENGNVIFS
jgi:hypothetical protein